MNTPESLRIKVARRLILRNLDFVFPSGLPVGSLYKTVCAISIDYDSNLFTKDIAYLEGKGYLLLIDDEIGGMPTFMSKVAKLTVKGKEIAEQTQSDSALEI